MGESINWGALKKEADDVTKPVPDGDYPTQVTKSELKPASTGAQMVVVQLTIIDGPHKGRIIFNNFVFSPDKAFALKMWFDNLAAFGLDDRFFGTGPSLEQVAAALLNRTAIVTVGQREWPLGSGTMRNEPKAFKRGGSAQQLAMAAASAGVSGTPGMPPVPAPAAASPSQPPVPSAPVVPSVGAGPTVGATPGAPPTPAF